MIFFIFPKTTKRIVGFRDSIRFTISNMLFESLSPEEELDSIMFLRWNRRIVF